jgi:predicted membrane-bound spermidine synthase
MSALLCLAFFLSGAAALVFESLWFRQAGLMLGNSVWATSLVTSAFMAGLATGNTWAARRGRSVRRPLVAYALLELLVAMTGLGLVLAFPALSRVSAPVLSAFVGRPAILNAARMAAAFLLMVVPSAAMGATLPLLVRTLAGRDSGFGRALGRLYGWNTIGAVAGALAGETVLLPLLGIRGAGLAAAALNTAAAATAFALSSTTRFTIGEPAAQPPPSPPAEPLSPRAHRLLAASFLAGGTLLALEVVWFRFLLLFLSSSTLAFAIMLAVVLLGIGAGGLAGSRWLKERKSAPKDLPVIALGCGIVSALAYGAFASVLAPVPNLGPIDSTTTMLALSMALMLPVATGSGALFTLAGEALGTCVADATRAAGLLTLANTLGATLGALAGGLLLLPGLGVERSIFLLSAVYAVVALVAWPGRLAAGPVPDRRRPPLVPTLAATGFVFALALFPFGLMRNHYLKRVVARWVPYAGDLVAYREGITETVFYLRRDLLGRPLTWRLATNGVSMSDTGLLGKRYMRLFVHWAIALRPDARKALLISYGVGSTARALTDTPSLERIDVVDVSRDVLEMGRMIFPPGQYPLDDPRVRTHVEDGRFFLLTAAERYDLITGEPPPPKNAGIVNLYTREYFQLLHDRLADGGIATYWLPVYQMYPREARAITTAFCQAFADCSLWSGSGLEWILAGTRGLRGPVDAAGFARQWSDPVLGRALRDVGIEAPEQLGALFIADADTLAEWTRGSLPLDDDHPLRLSPKVPPLGEAEYVRMMDVDETRARFERSRFVRELWPEALRARALDYFAPQRLVNAVLLGSYVPGLPRPGLAELGRLVTSTTLKAPVLWTMGATMDEERAADEAVAAGLHEPRLDEILGIRAMSERDYRAAEELLARAQPYASHADRILRWRILAMALAGDRARAAALLTTRGSAAADERDEPEWRWLEARLTAEE